MRIKLFVLCMALCSVTPAMAEVSADLRLGNVSIGINLDQYPELAAVPGYPVYYAPELDSNYFFYDGQYWVFQDDSWYSSSWYNGPWAQVDPEFVPVYVLRIPVRYYRQPPRYFRSWSRNAAPRWDEHWGRDWAQRRNGWDRWDRRSAPPPAPLPIYQQRYSSDHYPREDQQRTLQNQNYRYQPHDQVDRRREPTPQARPPAPPQHGMRVIPQESENESQRVLGIRPSSSTQPPPHASQPDGNGFRQRAAPPQPQPQSQRPQPSPDLHQQPETRYHDQGAGPQDDGGRPGRNRGQGEDRGNHRDRPDDRGPDRDR